MLKISIKSIENSPKSQTPETFAGYVYGRALHRINKKITYFYSFLIISPTNRKQLGFFLVSGCFHSSWSLLFFYILGFSNTNAIV